MPSVQVTAPAVVNIPNVTGRIVATMMSAPGEAWITTDGTVPVAPSNVILPTSQKTLAGVTGAQVVLMPIMPGTGGHSTLPVVQIGSAGAPVIELEW
jgi:hypothetical protein